MPFLSIPNIGYHNMVTPISSKSRPYETYTPSGLKTPYVNLLEHRINELIQRILQDENGWKKGDLETMLSLKANADFLILQRDALIQEVKNLSNKLETSEAMREISAQELENALNSIKKTDAVIWSGGLGFGAGAALSILCHLSPELTAVSTAVSTLGCIALGKAIAK
jgi:hypothetical protein